MTDTDTSAEAVGRLAHDCELARGALRKSPSIRAILGDTYVALKSLVAERDALRDKVERLEAAIKRQAGAAKTLRDLTLSEVSHLKEKDRSEYVAAKTVDSEREANAILTDENDALRAQVAEARNTALEEAADKIVSDTTNTLNGLSSNEAEICAKAILSLKAPTANTNNTEEE